MDNKTYNNLNLSVEYDPFRDLIGSIVKCTKKSGKTFAAKLIAVTPQDELWFETRQGFKTMDKRHNIESIVAYAPYSPGSDAKCVS